LRRFIKKRHKKTKRDLLVLGPETFHGKGGVWPFLTAMDEIQKKDLAGNKFEKKRTSHGLEYDHETRFRGIIPGGETVVGMTANAQSRVKTRGMRRVDQTRVGVGGLLFGERNAWESGT